MRKIFFLLPLLFLVFVFSCKKADEVKKQEVQPSVVTTNNVYRYYCGKRDDFDIWIVDGAIIRKEIFNEFVYGGNDRRYSFIPVGEIWVDNSITGEEFDLTVLHEINERNLMAKGMTYFDAHDSSLALELDIRRRNLIESQEYESKLPKVAPLDFDSTQEIEDLPDLIKLKNIYRMPEGDFGEYKIWIVDGNAVRRDIYPDFGFSGNYKAYYFIPENEIWLDGSVSCEELEYSIMLEIREIEEFLKGKNYDDAYTEALKTTDIKRKENQKLCEGKKPIFKTHPLVREIGTKQ
jgi:hypothetical protein